MKSSASLNPHNQNNPISSPCQVDNPESIDAYVGFSEVDEDYRCLCTFPHNWTEQRLDSNDVRSLAMLGAAVILASQTQDDDARVYIPQDIPEWMRAEVDRVLGAL